MNESSRPSENGRQRGPSPIRGLVRLSHAGLKAQDFLVAILRKQVIDRPREQTKKPDPS